MQSIIFRRSWAMPSHDTFSIKPINELVRREVARAGDGLIVDPFVRNSPFKASCLSNDLDPNFQADYNMDALDFLRKLNPGSVDLVLYDPPYSVRQVAECYRGVGMNVTQEMTRATFWTNIKKEIARVTPVGGRVVCCGWNSGGVGKNLGFAISEILLVPHGGVHNDTIVTVCEKVR